jgi:hypothetical protein
MNVVLKSKETLLRYCLDRSNMKSSSLEYLISKENSKLDFTLEANKSILHWFVNSCSDKMKLQKYLRIFSLH